MDLEAPPGDRITYYMYGRGYMRIQNYKLTADAKGVKVEIPVTRPQIITGIVVDKDTKQPIDEFVVEKGFLGMAGHPDGIWWTSPKQGRRGKFRRETVMPSNKGYRYRILAEGYEPYITNVIPVEEGEVGGNYFLKKAVTKHDESHPRIIMAEHVLLWDNEIVTWEQLVERLRERRKSGPFKPTFFHTNGLVAKQENGWQFYHDRIMGLYRELFEPAGVTFSGLMPRGSRYWDTIRTADDLSSNPRLGFTGSVLTPDGKPAIGAQVVVLPTKDVFAMLAVEMSGTKLREPWNELWSPTDASGKFVVNPQDDEYLLAILHPEGFAYQHGIENRDKIKLELWATIRFANEKLGREATLSITPASAMGENPGFKINSLKLTNTPTEVKVPAGKITVQHSLKKSDDKTVSYPMIKFELKPGEARTVSFDQ